MQFIDEAHIQVVAGKGGDGCVSFLRQRNRPKGGPDGGDGGNGGNVILRVDPALNTLVDFRFHRLFRASNGKPGQGSQKTGGSGEHLYISVPLGTRVCDAHSNQLLGELLHPCDQLCVARGGKAGVGNMRFVSSTHRMPFRFTHGKEGEVKELFFELQLLADIGLVGLPNAGKSSLLRRFSAATPKVADYPFTTITPQLGVMHEYGQEAVIADIPGLIAGAASGRGLGNRFLRHIFRTTLLWHVIDVQPLEGDPIANYVTIMHELEQSASGNLAALTKKDMWVILNKCDMIEGKYIHKLQQQLMEEHGCQVFCISALTGEGCDALARAGIAKIHTKQQPTAKRSLDDGNRI